MTSRPNILFAIADDASHFSAYGHRFVNTPHFDRVAREGVRFDAMFTTNPKCAPSRASLLTGRHTWQCGAAATHYCYFPGPDQLTVYPDLLEEAGYHVGFTGKGWAPGDFRREGRTRDPAGPEYNQVTLAPPEGSAINACDYAGNFDAFLEERERTNPDCPFYFWYGGKEPHRRYVPGEGEAHGKDLASIDAVPPYWPDEPVVRSDMLDYAYETEWFDMHLGRMLEALARRGELDNTLVIVTSDNGCPFPRVKGQMYDDDFRMPFAARWPGQIPAGQVCTALTSFIDLCPTFLELAGMPVSDAVAGSSLLPFLHADADAAPAPPSREYVVMGRERHDLGREGDLGYPVRCLRTDRYLYVRNFAPDRWPAGNPETNFPNCDSSPTKARILELHREGESGYFDLAFGKRPEEELYDVRNDPHCMTNLASRPEHASTCATLWRKLAGELEATDDPRMRGEGDGFDAYEYVNHDKAAHSWKAYVEGWGRPLGTPAKPG